MDVVRLLLDAGEDPNRYNPDGNCEDPEERLSPPLVRKTERHFLQVTTGGLTDPFNLGAVCCFTVAGITGNHAVFVEEVQLSLRAISPSP